MFYSTAHHITNTHATLSPFKYPAQISEHIQVGIFALSYTQF